MESKRDKKIKGEFRTSNPGRGIEKLIYER